MIAELSGWALKQSSEHFGFMPITNLLFIVLPVVNGAVEVAGHILVLVIGRESLIITVLGESVPRVAPTVIGDVKTIAVRCRSQAEAGVLHPTSLPCKLLQFEPGINSTNL